MQLQIKQREDIVLAFVTIFFSFLRFQTLDGSVGWGMQRRERGGNL